MYIVIIKSQNSTLSCVGSEQPGLGATLLGWPKSIYYWGHFIGMETQGLLLILGNFPLLFSLLERQKWL